MQSRHPPPTRASPIFSIEHAQNAGAFMIIGQTSTQINKTKQNKTKQKPFLRVHTSGNQFDVPQDFRPLPYRHWPKSGIPNFFLRYGTFGQLREDYPWIPSHTHKKFLNALNKMQRFTKESNYIEYSYTNIRKQICEIPLSAPLKFFFVVQLQLSSFSPHYFPLHCPPH